MTTLADMELKEALEDNARLRRALEPFAQVASLDELRPSVADDYFPVHLGLMNGNVTQTVIRDKLDVSHFRRAAEALGE